MPAQTITRKIVNRHFLMLVPDDSTAIGVRVEEVVIEYRDQAGLGQATETAAKRSLKAGGKASVDFLDDIKVLLVKDIVTGTDQIEVDVPAIEPTPVKVVP